MLLSWTVSTSDVDASVKAYRLHSSVVARYISTDRDIVFEKKLYLYINFALTLTMRKLESSGYPTVETP